MIFDAHIHQYYECPDDPAVFLEQAQKSGIGGGNIFSVTPEPGLVNGAGDYRWQARLEKVLQFTEKTPGFYPFFWINPMENDMEKQITKSVESGICGFKIICENYYPCDTIPACSLIGETGLPVMFHSGILGDSRDKIYGKQNKPLEFECLFAVRGLKFSLAHVGWPWIDDYMAMAAKASFTYDPDFGNEMFFDLTPGTPGINRADSLRKLYLTGYNVKHRVLWGTDGATGGYVEFLPQFWLKQDKEIMEEIGKDSALAMLPHMTEAPDLSDIFDLATEKNWKRFMNKA